MRHGRGAAALLAAAACLLCLAPGCAPQPVTRQSFALDTLVSVTLYDPADADLPERCFALIREKEALLSKTVPGSDVWNVNHAQGRPTEVAEETARLLTLALECSRISGGAFDVTVAPVSALWDFTAETPALPEEAAVQEARTHVDYTGVRIEGSTVTLADPQAGIDLGAIAKGYIADCVCAFLREQGVRSALVDLGGNIAAVGDKAGAAFRIGVRDPEQAQGVVGIVPARDTAVVTSGDYERCFVLDGVRYHHLLDPRTGYPARSGLRSVTVTGADSAWCDALATACYVLGAQQGMALIEATDGVQALFVTEDGKLLCTSGLILE